MGGDLIVHRGRPTAAIVFAAVAVALLAIAWGTGNNVWARCASLPVLLAIACGITQGPHFEGRLAADKFEVRKPRAEEIPYSDIRSIATRRSVFARKGRAPCVRAIFVQYPMGLIEIPAHTDVLANVILDQLAERAGYGGGGQVGTALAEYLRGQIELFGSDRVYAYRARGLGLPHGGKRLVMCGLACWLSFLVFALTSPAKGGELPVAGCWLLPLGFLLGLVALSKSGRVPSPLGSASLVISPQGFALAQADVVGELKWAEVRGLKFGHAPTHHHSFRFRGSADALLVEVEGAVIGIADCYDRPIEFIHRILTLYSTGSARCSVCGGEIRAPAGPGCVACIERRSQAERTVE
jgi:hypothetical protein